MSDSIKYVGSSQARCKITGEGGKLSMFRLLPGEIVSRGEVPAGVFDAWAGRADFENVSASELPEAVVETLYDEEGMEG